MDRLAKDAAAPSATAASTNREPRQIVQVSGTPTYVMATMSPSGPSAMTICKPKSSMSGNRQSGLFGSARPQVARPAR